MPVQLFQSVICSSGLTKNRTLKTMPLIFLMTGNIHISFIFQKINYNLMLPTKKQLMLLIVAMALSVATNGNDAQNLYVKDGAYGLTRLQAPDYQKDVLLTPINITFSNKVDSRGKALNELLVDSGLRLAKAKRIPATDKSQHDLLFDQRLPSILRRLGPVSLGQAIQAVIGPSWTYDVDPVTQRIDIFIKKDQVNYANLRANLAERGIISDQGNGEVWNKKSFTINFRPGSDVILNPEILYNAMKAFTHNKSRIEKIQVVGRSHSADNGAKKTLAVKRSNKVVIKLIENKINEELIEMSQSILNNQPRQIADAVITLTASMLPKDRAIPHTDITDHSNIEIDNIDPNCRTFVIFEGSLKSSIERALDDCDFSIGHWNIREPNGDISDRLIHKAFSFSTTDLIGFLDTIMRLYNIHSNINTLDRTVDFHKEKLSY